MTARSRGLVTLAEGPGEAAGFGGIPQTINRRLCRAGINGGMRVKKSVGQVAFAGIELGDVILMADNTPV